MEKKKTERDWKKFFMIWIPLVIGIGIGIFLGMSIEKSRTRTTGQSHVSPVPTLEPTTVPSKAPTLTPTTVPSKAPTLAPTTVPTKTPTLVPTKTPVAEEDGYYGPLHVEGTYLADEEGNLVQLRGISTHGIGWFPQYVNEAAIRQFRQEWGCNVFRLAMYTAESAGYCTGDAAHKEKLKKLIDTGVKAATAEDMYVIIDWHVLQDKDPNLYKEEAKKFFAEMAENYADNPNVLYEICNEPNSGVSWSQIKQYALEVIPVIREYAPEAVIIVGTPTWSQDVDVAAKDPITQYDNIMYALHFYADTHRDSLREKCKKAVQMGLPIFVTEYGTCAASGDGYVNVTEANKWIALLDGYGISHVAWNLSNKNESSSMIASNCSKTSGFTESDLSTGGKWFVDMLQEAGVGLGSALSGTTDAGKGGDAGGSHSQTSGEITGSSGDGSGKTEDSGTQVTDFSAYAEEIFTTGEGVLFSVNNGWDSGTSVGMQLTLTIKNETGREETDWERQITVKDGVMVEIEQSWSATVELKGNRIVIGPADYNRTIGAGGSVGNIGVIVNITE